MIPVIIWAVAAGVVLAVLAIAAAVPILTILLAEQAVRAVQALRRGRDVIGQTREELSSEPVPYWPSDEPDEKTVSRLGSIVFCPVCHPGGHGRCTCVAFCGDRQCTYGYTAQLSAEEAAWLRGLGIKEGTDQ